MVNYNDPIEIQKDYMAAEKLWEVANGIYVWEFLTSLDYEWSVIRGRRPFRWTILVYSFARLSLLMSVILNKVGVENTARINCQVLAILDWLSGAMAIGSASLLIVLRIFAVWNWNKVIIVIATSIWLANIGVQLEVGLFQLRNRTGHSSLWHLLWKQGAIWILLATVHGSLPTLFMILDLNDLFNIMFILPSMVTMIIGATRMYRSLSDFSSPESIARSGHSAPFSNATHVSHLPSDRLTMEVAVHSTYDEYPMSQIRRHVSYPGTDGQKHGKQQEPTIHDDRHTDKEK
ncbi:hypothetical protein F5148DRAFT_314819 [Russula earlei]|uniref:Uncharacterized protein n=1 Tax=Russula earlei TaxID=71964 RepID=A0ACC0U3Q0_9AGAM|nr:hypothetical protein F5148DRAFT_314819 [Russula earlei]